jgi:hypothetical protein
MYRRCISCREYLTSIEMRGALGYLNCLGRHRSLKTVPLQGFDLGTSCVHGRNPVAWANCLKRELIVTQSEQLTRSVHDTRAYHSSFRRCNPFAQCRHRAAYTEVWQYLRSELCKILEFCWSFPADCISAGLFSYARCDNVANDWRQTDIYNSVVGGFWMMRNCLLIMSFRAALQ